MNKEKKLINRFTEIMPPINNQTANSILEHATNCAKISQEYTDQETKELKIQLEKSRESARSVSRDLRTNIERQNEQIASLKSQLAKADQEIKTITEDSVHLTNRIKEHYSPLIESMQSKLYQADQENAELKAEVEKYKAVYEDLQQVNLMGTEMLKRKERDVKEKDALIESLQSQLSQAEADKQELLEFVTHFSALIKNEVVIISNDTDDDYVEAVLNKLNELINKQTMTKVSNEEQSNNANVLLADSALSWWNSITLEEQFYKTIAWLKDQNRNVTERHPHKLSVDEIIGVYQLHLR